MRLPIITGAVLAALTGVAIAMQSTITSRVGAQIGDIRTGILTNTMGGIIAGGMMLVWLVREGPEAWKVPPGLNWRNCFVWVIRDIDNHRNLVFSPASWSSGRIGRCDFWTAASFCCDRFLWHWGCGSDPRLRWGGSWDSW